MDGLLNSNNNTQALINKMNAKNKEATPATQVEKEYNDYMAKQQVAVFDMYKKGANAQQMFEAGIRPDVIDATMKQIKMMNSSPISNSGLMK